VPLVLELDDADDEPLSSPDDVEAACAATPAAIVPARPAATSPTVTAVVRARPCSRSMETVLLQFGDIRIVAGQPRRGLCRS
jgi:hypothetical protein